MLRKKGICISLIFYFYSLLLVGPLRPNHEHEHPPLLRQKTVSPQPMLDSKSAFFGKFFLLSFGNFFYTYFV